MKRPSPCVRLLVPSLLVAFGCADPVDRAAKARIFSPEDPPRVVASAQEPLPPERLAESPNLVRRVLGMGAAEATERLGPHRVQSTLTTEWTRAGGSQKLVETRSLACGRGGVGGDFHATVHNSRDQGLEVMRVAGEVFAKNRYGKFRQRLRDRGMAERVRDETSGALRDLDVLFGGRLHLTPMGTVTHQSRPAWRFKVSLAAEPSSQLRPDGEQPSLRVPKGGGDADTLRRQAFWDKRQPRSLEGTVVVDQATSVVLRAKVDGTLEVPEPQESPATVRIQLEQELTGLGQDVSLARPLDFLPDQDKPEGIADALDRFGVPRAGSDAGTALPSSAEPDDEG